MATAVGEEDDVIARPDIIIVLDLQVIVLTSLLLFYLFIL
jgi:hypothetical protein